MKSLHQSFFQSPCRRRSLDHTCIVNKLIHDEGSYDGKHLQSRRSILISAAPLLCCTTTTTTPVTVTNRNPTLDKLFAQCMNEYMEEYEQNIASVKQKLFSQLYASSTAKDNNTTDDGAQPLVIAEIGIGTGPNLKYYNPQKIKKIIAIDPNEYMRPYLEANLKKNGFHAATQMEWCRAQGEALPLPDDSVDVVVYTLVLCSVSDVKKTVEEAKRILKKKTSGSGSRGGQLLFIEHTIAPPTRPVLLVAQQVLNPLQRALADGCNLNRDPLPIIEDVFVGGGGGSGNTGMASKVDVIRFDVEGASLISPHVAGVVTM